MLRAPATMFTQAARRSSTRCRATCVRHLVSIGVAAPDRIACAGRSYGGYLTLAALVFRPDLFVAGVDICGMADFHTFYAHTEPWIAEAAYPKYGHPVHDEALLRSLSPIHRFDALRAPILVVHGENDTNVPLEEALQVVDGSPRYLEWLERELAPASEEDKLKHVQLQPGQPA